MSGRDVGRLGRVGLEVDEHSRHRQRQVFRRHALSPRSHAGKRPCRVGEEELVAPAPDRLELVVEIPETVLVLCGGSGGGGLAAKETADAADGTTG